eukprot:SAG22_NODE_17483_length_304_cov_0.678049_1_plen_56_part_10
MDIICPREPETALTTIPIVFANVVAVGVAVAAAGVPTVSVITATAVRVLRGPPRRG